MAMSIKEMFPLARLRMFSWNDLKLSAENEGANKNTLLEFLILVIKSTTPDMKESRHNILFDKMKC